MDLRRARAWMKAVKGLRLCKGIDSQKSDLNSQP